MNDANNQSLVQYHVVAADTVVIFTAKSPTEAWYDFSLVPRLIREPGINCLRMRVISPRSGEIWILTAFYSFTGTSRFRVTSPGYDG